MLSPRMSALALLCLSACATTRFVPKAAVGFRLIDAPDGRYWAYVPPSADGPATPTGRAKLPVVLYLHGGDERGSDPLRPTQVGLGPLVHDAQGHFPFIVLFPQCPRGRFWAQPDQLARLGRILDDALARLDGDRERVYLTGNSLGGYGSWLLAAEQPDRFAAIVPICGGVRPPRSVPVPKESRFGRLRDPYTAVAAAIGALPVWAFHGAKDWLVSPDESRRLVAALRTAGNDAKLTIYADLGHRAWDRAYADPALWTWLAAQRRSPTAPTPAPPGIGK